MENTTAKFVQEDTSSDNHLGFFLAPTSREVHSQGITPMCETLGLKMENVEKNILGLDAYTIDPKAWEESVKIRTDGDITVYTLDPTLFDDTERYEDLLERLESEELVGAWDKDTFVVAAKGDKAQAALFDIYKEGERENLALLLLDPVQTVTSLPGLCFFRKDRIPEYDDVLRDAAISKHKLKVYVDEIGILEEVKASGKGHFMCLPEWVDGNEQEKARADNSEFAILLALHPEDMQHYTHGVFTVEEVRKWINEDAGPIVRDTPQETMPGTFTT